MDEYQTLSARERAMGMSNTALVEEIVGTYRAVKSAMSQSAALGNTQMAGVYIEELERRATDLGDSSIITGLNARLASEFAKAPKEF